MNRTEAIEKFGIETIETIDGMPTHVAGMINACGMYEHVAELGLGDDHWLTVTYEITPEIFDNCDDDLPGNTWENPIYEVE